MSQHMLRKWVKIGITLLVINIVMLVVGCNGKKASKVTLMHNNNLIIKVETFSPYKEKNIHYPVLSGFADPHVQVAINEKLRHLFFIIDDANNSQEESDATFECDFEFEQLNNVLIITQHSYSYEEGAAHGFPSLQIFHIDIHTGEFYHLKDLLHSEEGLETIRELLQEKFEAKKAYLGYLVDTIPPLSADQVFKLSRTGIEIYFHPYEIACYADGFVSFEITFEEMINALNKEGCFFESVSSVNKIVSDPN